MVGDHFSLQKRSARTTRLLGVVILALTPWNVTQLFWSLAHRVQVYASQALCSKGFYGPNSLVFECAMGESKITTRPGFWQAADENGQCIGAKLPIPLTTVLSDAGIRTGFDSVLFCKGLQRPDGEVRLVVVTKSAVGSTNAVFIHRLRIYVIMPGSLFTKPVARIIDEDPEKANPIGQPRSGILEIFSGSPDSSDSTHLTIPYRYNGSEGLLEGWLRKDDSVEIKYSSGPGEASNAKTEIPIFQGPRPTNKIGAENGANP